MMNTIETERLQLKKLSFEDATFILELLNDPDWLKYIGDRGVRNLKDAHDYIINGPVKSYNEHGFGLLRISLKDSANPIGICGLLKREYLEEVDIGFAFLPEFRGKGYATESAAAVIHHGRDALGLHRILAITQSDNIRSIRVLKKLGFEFEKMVYLPDSDQELELYGVNL